MTKRIKSKQDDGPGGTYVYDKDLGKVVKVSSRVPKVASKGKKSGGQVGPCGRVCGDGPCG